jgi:OFA family oxalate/formate antiporter-like MFS transporter
MSQSAVPGRAWVVTFAGTAVNLCLGILYAWSVWKAGLVAPKEVEPGTPMTGLNEGWEYLSDADATWAYAICGFTFAVTMIPGGRLQDRYGPRLGAILGGLSLAAGCVIAGVMKSYLGLIVGFGLMGGIGMGLGYAAATPAAVKWFGPHRRGLIVGLVVGGYGAAAVYISPLGTYLVQTYGLTGSFIGLGCLFAVVVIAAGSLLKRPPGDYVPPAAPPSDRPKPAVTAADWSARDMLGTWQFYALVFLFIGAAQSGLLVIANAALMLRQSAAADSYFASNAWLLASFGGVVNAVGRIGTGSYSDAIGRRNAYALNGLAAVICLFLLPVVGDLKSVLLLFLLVGVVYWQYGGGLALLPALTADFYGSKNLGLNYGLVFLGWGIAFFIPQLAGYIKVSTGRTDVAFYLSGGLLLAAVALSRMLRRPDANLRNSSRTAGFQS